MPVPSRRCSQELPKAADPTCRYARLHPHGGPAGALQQICAALHTCSTATQPRAPPGSLVGRRLAGAVSLIAGLSRLEPREEPANALGIHAHIAATDPRHGTEVQLAPTRVGRDPNYYIVCEAEEQAGVRSFEAPVLRLGGDDRPAQGARRRFRLCKECGGREGREVGDDVGIRLPLGRRNSGTLVGQPIGRGGARGRQCDEGGGMFRIRRDIMNGRDASGFPVVVERHPSTEQAEQQPHVCRSPADALAAHPASHGREQTHHEGRQARDCRPLHEGEQGEADVPHPEPIAERGKEGNESADERQPQAPRGSDSQSTVHDYLPFQAQYADIDDSLHEHYTMRDRSGKKRWAALSCF